MKTVFHTSDSRGHVNFGWLDSHHTFSFGNYYNPERIQFGALRVLNDDIVTGGAGFGAHPHDNMEIISIPLKGALEHRDNTGGQSIIQAGEVQIMSAGTGITHSEKNASSAEDVNFLQVWVLPKEKNITPRYDQKVFSSADRENVFQTVVSPSKDKGSLWINQDVWFSLGNFKKGSVADYAIHKKGNGIYLFVIEGSVYVDDHELSKRDGLGVWDIESLSLSASTNTEVLLIEVPMN